MTQLLEQAPYSPRDDETLLNELIGLSAWHRSGCPEYRSVWPNWQGAVSFAELPYLHVSGFKHVSYRTMHEGLNHGRVLTSSSTSGASPSRISLDETSSAMQSRSTAAILRDYVGTSARPLLVLDDAQNLRKRGEVSARIAAALGLQALASDLRFVVSDRGATPEVNWASIASALEVSRDIILYGFTWILWQAWASQRPPRAIEDLLRETKVAFVHSGGWKRMQAASVGREEFETALLSRVAPGSLVIDYYGLVEQIGVVYPLCRGDVRHVPRWAHVIVRDPWSLEPTAGDGLLQLLNPLAKGAPYHSVLTEDVGRLVLGACECGRVAPAFELLGRVPQAEVRGCGDA